MADIIEIQAYLQKFTQKKVTLNDIGKALGTGRSNISSRAKSHSQVTNKELILLENDFKVDLNNFKHSEQNVQSKTSIIAPGDKIEIHYWDGLPEELKNPKIVSVWFDREIIENVWGMSDDHLCIVPMIGDKMTNYWYPIRNNDILIIDTSQDYITGNGVYFGTSRNNTQFWIREMQLLMDLSYEFKGYAPSGETRKVYKPTELEAVDFRLIGKVIKNVSFRL